MKGTTRLTAILSVFAMLSMCFVGCIASDYSSADTPTVTINIVGSGSISWDAGTCSPVGDPIPLGSGSFSSSTSMNLDQIYYFAGSSLGYYIFTPYLSSKQFLISDASYSVTYIFYCNPSSGYALESISPSSSNQYTSNITITVTFKASNYTVAYDGNSGSSTKSSDSVTPGSSVTLPSASRTNYTFNGWYTAASGGTRLGGAGDTYTPTSSTTLYAQWAINKYTVAYDSNGGSSASSSTVNAGSSVTLPTVTKTNNILNGWYTAASGSTKIGDAGDTYTPTSSTTLYAQWIVSKYAVTFNANGGSSNSSSTVNVGCSVTLPTVTKSGYQLAGWYTKSSGGTKIGDAGASYTPTSDITLYAQWKQIITISTTASTSAVVGSSYSYTPSANVSGCTVTVSGPSWLSVSNGKVVGTPTSNGAFSYTVTMAKSGCVSATQTVSGTVYSSLTFTNPTNYSMAYVVVGQ